MVYRYQAYAKIIYSETPLPLQPLSAGHSESELLLEGNTISLKRGEIDTNITYTHKIEDSGIKYSVNTDHIIVAVERVAVYKIVYSTEGDPAEVIFDAYNRSYPESSEKHIGLLFLHLILQFLITGPGPGLGPGPGSGTSNPHTQFLFHGSAISLPDNAGVLVLLGEKGAGKSTIAAALSLSGCSLLCDDIVPILHGPSVLPGIARAKLLPDAYQRLCGDPETAGHHFDGISKYYTDLPQTQTEISLPLTAIIYLEQKAVTSVDISPLRGARKFQKMIKQVIRIDGMDTAEVLFETVTANCRDIPLYQITIPVNADPWVVVGGIMEAWEGRQETGGRKPEIKKDLRNKEEQIMLKFPKTVMQSTVDDEMVLMDTKKGEYFGLNKTGTVLLETLLETQSTASAIAKTVELFDAPGEIIAGDLEQLVEDLLRRKLLVEE